MVDTYNPGGIIPPPPIDLNPPVQEAQVVPENNTPIPVGPIAPVVELDKPVEHKYRAVRGSGDQVFLIVENRKHWVLNPETFSKLGFKFGEEEKVEQAYLSTLLPGETITSQNYTKFL